MARKSKEARGAVTLECSECSQRNYRTSKRLSGGIPKLEVKKYCRWCRKHQLHKERKK